MSHLDLHADGSATLTLVLPPSIVYASRLIHRTLLKLPHPGELAGSAKTFLALSLPSPALFQQPPQQPEAPASMAHSERPGIPVDVKLRNGTSRRLDVVCFPWLLGALLCIACYWPACTRSSVWLNRILLTTACHLISGIASVHHDRCIESVSELYLFAHIRLPASALATPIKGLKCLAEHPRLP